MDMTKPVDVVDEAVLRAYAHPTRLRLLDLLRAQGPATIGMLAERADEAVGSVSHHMKLLAKAQLVEPAPDLARDKREHWWRVNSAPRRWSRRELSGAAARTALTAEEIILERQVAYTRRALHADDPGWNGFSTSSWLRLTPAALERLEREIVQLISRFDEESREHPDGAGEPVLVFARGLHVDP